jgi:hypothetical protein
MDIERTPNILFDMLTTGISIETDEVWYHQNGDSSWSHRFGYYDKLKGKFKDGMFDGYWEKCAFIGNTTHKYYYI